MPTISLSSRVLTATLAIIVTVPSASISTGVSLLTAVATSTATVRGPAPRAGPWAVRSPPNQLAGGNHLATSSGFPNSPAAIAPPATASTAASPNKVLPLVITSLPFGPWSDRTGSLLPSQTPTGWLVAPLSLSPVPRT